MTSTLPDVSSADTINSHFRADSDLENSVEKATIGIERQPFPEAPMTTEKSVYQGLGWLNSLLVLWILLAIIIGILLGNYVDSVGSAL